MILKGYSAFPIAQAVPSDYLVSCPGLSLRGSYPSAEKQSMYSTAPADRARRFEDTCFHPKSREKADPVEKNSEMNKIINLKK